MALLMVGLNHKSAPLEIREKVSFPEAELPEALGKLLDTDDVSEAVVLSTCNRTEVYMNAVTAMRGREAFGEFLRDCKNLSDEEAADVDRCLYSRQGEAMAENLFRVVSSLDSLVVGEAQILGQVRRAFLASEQCGATGEVLDKLFKMALELGKQVRSETQIGQQSVSVSTVAVQLAKEILGSLDGRSILIIGAGEMAELTLAYLRELGVERVFVANRTSERSLDLIERIGCGESVAFEAIEEALNDADIAISSVFSDGYVVDAKMAARVAFSRAGRPLMLVDIALPRNIDPACGEAEGIHAFDLDDLGAIARRNMAQREAEAAKAEDMVANSLAAYLLWLQEREVTPTIKGIYDKAGTVCEREVARACKEMAKVEGRALSEEEKTVFSALAESVVKKILHGPVIRMRKQVGNPDAYIYTSAARFLFGLDSNPFMFPCAHREDHCALDKGHACYYAQTNACPFGRFAQE